MYMLTMDALTLALGKVGRTPISLSIVMQLCSKKLAKVEEPIHDQDPIGNL